MRRTGMFVGLMLLSATIGLAFNDDGGDGGRDFKGLVQSLPASGFVGNWMVGGSPVVVTISTEVRADDGPLVIGACVEVKGQILGIQGVLASEVRTQKLSDCGQVEQNNIDFTAVVQSLPAGGLGTWMIGGQSVLVTALTVVKQSSPAIAAGTCVEVKGMRNADSSVTASEIDAQSGSACGLTTGNQTVDLVGVVQSVPASGTIGDFVVSGQTVHVTAATTVKSAITIGECVEVKGQRNADSSIAASEIDADSNSACGITGVPVDFQGTVQQLPASGLSGDWMVAALTIHVTAATRIEQDQGPVAVGSCVEVKGQGLADGSVNATQIEIRSSSAGCGATPPPAEQEFLGLVQTLPATGLTGDWTVSGRTVHVTLSTNIQQQDSVVAVGACVDVEGSVQTDNSLAATRIDVRPATACAAAIGGVTVDFDGTIAKLPAGGTTGDWLVGTTSVHVLPGTSLQQDEGGTLAVGQCVEVKGQMLADQTVDALSIESKSASSCGVVPAGPRVDVMGLVQKLPAGGGLTGDWQVNTQVVHVLPGTSIEQEDGAVTVGACVDVKGTVGADQSITASEIEVESLSGTCISGAGVVDAASMLAGGVSPGELVSMFGLRLGPSGMATTQVGDDGKVTTSLAGVQVLFDGQPAPLLAVTNGQINAVVPFAVAGHASTQVQVENGGVWSNPVSIPVVGAHPAAFTNSGSGHDQAASLNQDGSRNSASRPASAGSIVVLFATGFGMANRPVQDGEVIEDADTKPALPVTVQIGGMDAEVVFAGMAPQEVAGVIQLNVRIPSGVQAGDAVPVQIKVGTFSAPAGVTIAVH